MDKNTWRDELAKKGAEGGMETEEQAEVILPPDGAVAYEDRIEYTEVLLDDLEAMVACLKKAPTRRAFPAQGVPAEILLMALAPKQTSTGEYDARKAGTGVGCLEEISLPKRFRQMMHDALAHIRQTKTFSLRQLQSSPFTADKADARPGIAGLRVLHCLSAWAMAWFGGSRAKTESA